MSSITNILVPTDCSDLSKVAVEYALMLGDKLDANLTLLSVSEEIPFDLIEPAYYSVEMHEQLANENDERSRKRLEGFWSSFNIENEKVRLISIHGYAFSAIINFIKENPIDMVVMGTHGRTGLKHVLLGSVAEKIVRYSPIPVLTIKNSEK